MKSDRIKKIASGLRSFLVFCLLLAGSLRASDLILEKEPLFLGRSLAPNLVLTFDTSAAMAMGFFPDVIAPYSAKPAAKSAAFNVLAYDPAVTYRPGLDSQGQPLPDADFFAAKLHISDMGAGVTADAYAATNTAGLDLSQHFRFIWNPLLYSGVLSSSFVYAAEAGDGALGQAAYYYVRNESNPGCNAADELDDDCYVKRVVTPAEQQNFANWYQYHALRYLKGKTVLSELVQTLPGDTRVAWQSTNGSQISGANHQNYVQSLESTGVKAAFYSWMFALLPQPSAGNPVGQAMLRAGQYFSNATDNNVYEQEPGAAGSKANQELACYANYHLMFSAGSYAPDATISLGNVDQQSAILPDGKIYDPASPYAAIYTGAGSNTLADIAFYYWSHDLRSDLPNQVSTAVDPNVSAAQPEVYWSPQQDVATWQHVNQWVLGLGAGNYDPLDPHDFNALLTGGTKWPSPFIGTVEKQLNARVDDLWHAAINGRGQYVSVFSSNHSDLLAFSAAIEYHESSVARLTATSASLLNGGAVFQAGFDSSDWSGFVRRYPLSSGQGPQDDTCHSLPAGTLCAISAEVNANSVQPWLQRKVFTLNPEQNTVGDKGVTLTGGAAARWQELSPMQQQDLVSPMQLDYMLGDASQEQQQGGSLRNRTDKQRALGAVVHASPVWVSNGRDQDGAYERLYPDALENTQTHESFLHSIAQRPAMLYVSANDGLLHAYQYDEGLLKEKFAYLPDTLLSQVPAFSSPQFAYTGWLDGPLLAADVFYSNAWHSVLVGSFRQGAKGLFALDVTHPETFNRQSVLWEYTPRTVSNDDLGFIYGPVSMVKTHAEQGADKQVWAAVTANGYNSVNGNAVLLFIDLKNGSTLASVDTGVGLNPNSPPVGARSASFANGLATPFMVDIDQDYIVDYAYAGDLYGNLWRFDLRSNDVAQWSATLIFTAAAGQPITAQAVVNRHPSQQGVLIYVGTGKYLEKSDDQSSASDATQAVYGIWDRLEQVPKVITPQHLLSQRILKEHSGSSAARVLSQNAVHYFTGTGLPNSPDTEGYLGWKLDFPAGERVLEAPLLRSGVLVLVTFKPNDSPCEAGGTSWLMALDAVSGGRLSFQVFDHDANGMVNVNDLVPLNGDKVASSGWQDAALGLLSAPLVQHDRSQGTDQVLLNSSKAGVKKLAMPTPSGSLGLKTWRRLR